MPPYPHVQRFTSSCLTARDDEVDKVLGLSIRGRRLPWSRPFSPRELMVVHQSHAAPTARAWPTMLWRPTQRTLGDLVVDTEARRVWRAGDDR